MQAVFGDRRLDWRDLDDLVNDRIRVSSLKGPIARFATFWG